MQVEDEVLDRQVTIRSSIDITREYLRCGALQGIVYDADGSELANLFDEFEITEEEINFDLGSATSKPDVFAREVVRHIENNLKGDMKTGVRAICAEDFFEALMMNTEFRDAHKYYKANIEPVQDDLRKGFKWQGITWEEYIASADVPQEDGSSVTKQFIEAGTARFFPEGTRTTFRDYNSPADYMETVNQPAQPFYSKLHRDPEDRFAKVDGSMFTLPMALRPAVLVKGKIAA